MANKIAILIETQESRLKPAMLGVITAARSVGHELYALVPDGRGADYQETLARYGVTRAVNLMQDDLVRPLSADSTAPDTLARGVIQALEHFEISTLLGLTSPFGKDLLPRVAALLDAPLALDCLSVDWTDGTVTKAQFSGKAIATFRLHGRHRIMGLRPNVIAPVPAPALSEVTDWTMAPMENPMEVIETTGSSRQGSDVALSEAEIIVAGGRGMGNGENFRILEDCAEALGGAVGASRVAVDSGWVPHTLQVGQTGTTVCPKLYIACGISGSVQHFAGMKTAQVIVAINQDPDAPLMRGCDYGIVGDLFEIVPLMTRALKNRAS